MKKNIVILVLVLVGMGMAGVPVSAGECPFSLHLSGLLIPSLSGDAGEGTNSPQYDDAFDMGLGLNIEGVYQLNEKFSILAGIGVESHSGSTFNDISFDDHTIMPVYIGGKYYCRSAKSGWNPYLRADIGMARFDSVDITYLGVAEQYWKSSWELMFDVGAGAEYRKDSFGFFLEIKARYMDSPSSAMSPFSDSGSTWSLPVAAGISIYF